MDARSLVTRAAEAWPDGRGMGRLTFIRPDEIERRGEAVDLLGRDQNGTAQLVLEHTLVESFLDQRSSQTAAIRMFGPLEIMLTDQLPRPGHYELSVRTANVLGLKRSVARVRDWVGQWARDIAPTLEIGGPETAPRHFATTPVPGTGLEVNLFRWPQWDGRFMLVFDAPLEAGSTLAPSLAKAVAAKCPKLATAKNQHPGSESLLLLEIHDIALGNLFDFDAVVQSWLAEVGTTASPDHIWLVDTTDEPPSVMVAKAGHACGGEVGARYSPFLLQAPSTDQAP